MYLSRIPSLHERCHSQTVTVVCEAEINLACYTLLVCQLVHLLTFAHNTILPIVYMRKSVLSSNRWPRKLTHMGTAVEEASKSSLTSCAIKLLWSLFFLSDTEMLSPCKMYALVTAMSMQW